MNRKFADIFVRLCGHVESTFVDRDFVLGPWRHVRGGAGRRVAKAADDAEFYSVLADLVDRRLPGSHCKFLPPELAAYIDLQSSEAGVPAVLRPVFGAVGDVLYARLASLSLPPFSLGPWIELLAGASERDTLIVDLRLCAGGSSSATGELLGLLVGGDRPYMTSRLSDWETIPTPEVLRPIPLERNERHAAEIDAIARRPHVEWRTRHDPPIRFDGRVVLVTGPQTYSCGELFVRVLRDAGRAVVVGRPTAGAFVGARDDLDCGHGCRVLLPFVRLLAPGDVEIEGHPVPPDVPWEWTSSDAAALSAEEIQEVLTHASFARRLV